MLALLRFNTALCLAAGLIACGSYERVPIGRNAPPLNAPPLTDCQLVHIDENQLTWLGPDDRSHWLQPWRAYRDTWPSRRMLDAAGFQLPFPPDAARLELFAAAGFRRVWTEVAWDAMQFQSPTALEDSARAGLAAFASEARSLGFRPMLLLDAPSTAAPKRAVTVQLTEAAPIGSRTLRAASANIGTLKAFKTIVSERPYVLVSAVNQDGTLELSRPLERALAAGNHSLTELQFAPFSRPTLASGAPNPLFEETISGWLSFLDAASGAFRELWGAEDFDIEIWNETLNANNWELFDINIWFDPPLEPDRPRSYDENLDAIRARSTAFLRDPSRGLTRVGIADGSGNARFAVSAGSEPAGITALSRHVSTQGLRLPAEAEFGSARSLDAAGMPNGVAASDGNWIEEFSPAYDVLQPELPLTALLPMEWRRPGQIARDLAPIPTVDSEGNTHGRSDEIEVWITSISTNLSFASELGITLSATERFNLQAKAALRNYAAYVGAGASLVTLWSLPTENLAYVDDGAADGGAAMRALQRFFERFESAENPEPPRMIAIEGVGSCAPAIEFEGDGSSARPALDHRQLVAAYPFQRGPRSFVIPTYVMTRNIMKQHGGAGAERFDLPRAPFELVLSRVNAATALVTAYDPLRDVERPVSVLSRDASRITLRVELDDAPVLLELLD
jgi:hypothetical protein